MNECNENAVKRGAGTRRPFSNMAAAPHRPAVLPAERKMDRGTDDR